MNNYITVLIETLYKTSNKKMTHNSIRSVQRQRIPKDNINTNHRDRNDNDSNDTRIWYGRQMKKPDRLIYN